MSEQHISNRELIKQDCEEIMGRYFIAEGRRKESYVLGAVDLVDDYYWVSVNKDGKMYLYSCVGCPDIFPESNITVNSDGMMVHTHTKFMERMSEDERKKSIDRIYGFVLDEVRLSAQELLNIMSLDRKPKPSPECIKEVEDEVNDRKEHPENYIINWIH